MKCKICGGPLIRRNRTLLLVVGAGLMASGTSSFRNPLLWAIALPFVLAGGYLILWATIGKGAWCRNCKTFPMP